MPSPNFDRDIGALQATVSMLADAMKQQAALFERQMRQQQDQYVLMISDIKADIAEMKSLREDIVAMKSLIDQAKGGWKILVGVGTISATIGVLIVKIASLVWVLPKA